MIVFLLCLLYICQRILYLTYLVHQSNGHAIKDIFIFFCKSKILLYSFPPFLLQICSLNHFHQEFVSLLLMDVAILLYDFILQFIASKASIFYECNFTAQYRQTNIHTERQHFSIYYQRMSIVHQSIFLLPKDILIKDLINCH